MCVVQHYCQWCSFVGLLVLCGGGCGGCDNAPVQSQPATSPQSTAAPRFRYTVTDLGTLGEDTSRANGINNNGQVVGELETSGGIEHPFLWDGTRGMQDLGGLGKGPGSAIAINDAGQVVGESCPQAAACTSGTPSFGRLAAGCKTWARSGAYRARATHTRLTREDKWWGNLGGHPVWALLMLSFGRLAAGCWTSARSVVKEARHGVSTTTARSWAKREPRKIG